MRGKLQAVPFLLLHCLTSYFSDFDDAFVFLVGTGAKCFSVISRKLGKVIWTLADHFEAGLEGPSTFALESESGDIPAAYASLERRRLKRA